MKPIAAISSISLRRVSRHLLAGALALGAAGCSLLPSNEPVVRYELPVSSVSSMASQRLPMTVAVATPMAGQALNSDRIVVMPEGNELSAYKGARWSDSAPIILRQRQMLALRESGLVQMVVPAGTGLRPDVLLGGDLSAFQVRYEHGEPVVQVVLDAALIRASNAQPLGVKRFTISQPVQGKQVPEVVQAYGQAVHALNTQIIEWMAPLLQAYASSTADRGAK